MKQILSTRSLRTFVLRQGRLTQGQQNNLQDYWPKVGVDVTDQPIDPQTLFERAAPVWLEIGFGNGESLARMARENPQINFLGIEVHLPGVGHLLGEIAAHDIGNIRVIRYDAVEVLERFLVPASIERLLLFFPDPWPKKRHHKRRMVNAEFTVLMNRVLADGGVFHTATDWPPYAEHIEAVMHDCEFFQQVESAESVVKARPPTKFETRGVNLGHPVSDLVFRRLPSLAVIGSDFE
jgi:tRNA (guanine-N7-)-methyltransferase